MVQTTVSDHNEIVFTAIWKLQTWTSLAFCAGKLFTQSQKSTCTEQGNITNTLVMKLNWSIFNKNNKKIKHNNKNKINITFYSKIINST